MFVIVQLAYNFLFYTTFLQVMDRYVDPLVANLRTMLGYRKFRRGSKAEVDEDLRHEKSANPMRIVYSFGVSHEHPGTFILSYIRSSNPHHEYIGLYPKGFKFRSKMFESLDRLVAYFQRHIDDLQHGSVPPIRSVAAMVPLRSPASGGGSVGSGWGGSTTSSGDGWRTRGHNDRDRSATPASRTGIDTIALSGLITCISEILLLHHCMSSYPVLLCIRQIICITLLTCIVCRFLNLNEAAE